ncbi:MAG: AgmX/PglI C-terminal domain-containing protein [Bdellovibrionales bacterium]
MKESIVVTVLGSDGRQILKKTFDEFPIVFGRNDDCHLTLQHEEAFSRVHGSIDFSFGEITITDLESSNGLYFNGERIYKVSDTQSCTVELKGTKIIVERNFHAVANADRAESSFDRGMSTVVANTAIYELAEVEKTEVGRNPNYEIPDNPSEMISREEIVGADESMLVHHMADQEIAIQGCIFWKESLFDVRQYNESDEIEIGHTEVDALRVPYLEHNLIFGQNYKNTAIIKLPKGFNWSVHETSGPKSWRKIEDHSELKFLRKKYLVLSRNQLCRIDLGHDVSMHIRYIKKERPFLERTWIENKDILAASATVTALVHALFLIGIMMNKPKVVAPKIEDVPQRFAKLLVEKPEPPKPKVEPPKPEEKKVAQPKPKPKPPKHTPVVKTKPVRKKAPQPAQPKKVVAKSPPPSPSPAPPQPSAEQQQAEDLASLFGGSTNTSKKLDNININNTSPSTNKSTDLMRTLSSKNGSLPPSNSRKGALGLSSAGYSSQKGSGAAAKVQGKVLGKPDLSEAVGSPQGLTRKQIMDVVNKHLGRIQQCYERALFNKADLAGRVEFEWTISPAGQVQTVGVRRSEMAGGEELIGCVNKLIKSWKFPKGKNALPTVANIGFPFGKL